MFDDMVPYSALNHGRWNHAILIVDIYRSALGLEQIAVEEAGIMNVAVAADIMPFIQGLLARMSAFKRYEWIGDLTTLLIASPFAPEIISL